MFKKFLAKKGLKPEDLANKTEIELAQLNAEFMEDTFKALEDALKNKASEEEIETIKTSIKDIPGYNDQALKDEVIELTKKVKALEESPKVSKSENVSMRSALVAGFEEKKEEIDSIVKSGGKQSGPLKIEVNKVAVDLTIDNTIGAGATQYTLTENTGIISTIRRREEKYLQAVSVGRLGSPRALWVEETDEQGVPIFLAEGDPKTKISSLWIEKTAEVKKIAAHSKVTTELMADLPQLVSFIQNSLLKRLSVATEDQLINGNNVGDNLAGAIYYATAFTPGANAASIDLANEFDVISAIALQVEVAFGIPNALFIHPSTWAKMKALKTTEGFPIWKQYVDTNGAVIIDGMKIITTTAVTAGEFVGGDMTVLNVLYRESLSIQIGLDGNDFTNNKKTILAEQRLVQFASANDTQVIVKGDFTTAKAALETV